MGTIEERIVIDYAQAVAGLRAVSGEARSTSAAVTETQRAASTAMASLSDVAAAMRASMSTASSQMAASVAGVQRNAVAEAMRAQMALAAQAQDKATESIRRMTEATAANTEEGQKAASMTGAVRAGYINLGNQIADVFAQMAGGASPFTIAVQQGPQALSALAGMGGAALTAAGGVAALGTAVVAGYGAWRIYYAEEIRAEKVASDLTAAHAELKPLVDSTRWAMIDLAEKTGQISPLMADLERNSLRALTAWGNATDETRAKLAALKREQSSVTTQIIDAGQAFYDAIDPTGLLSEGYQRLWGGSRELQIEIDAQTAAVDQSIVSLRENRKVTEDAIIADEAAKRAKEAHTEAARAQRDALAELKKAQDELWNSLKRENEERKVAVALANAEAALAFSRGTTSEAAMQRVGTAGRMAELRALDPRVVNDREAQIKAMTDLATTLSFQDAATRENTNAIKGLTEAAIQSAAGSVGAFGNGPSAFMSSFGPWGQAINGIINAVVNLDGTFAQFEQWHESFMTALSHLPETIVKNIPKAFVEGTVAAFKFIPDLLLNLFDPETWKNVGKNIAEGIWRALGDSWGDLVMGPQRQGIFHDIWRGNRGEGGISHLFGLIKGQHDTGAWNVQSPGLYMLHGGERVLTSGQATSARNRTGGGGVTIQIGSVMGGRAGVRELVDLIRRESGPLGSRVSLGV